MRIAIISPYTLPVKRGNSLTAERIKSGLMKENLTVSLFNSSKDSYKNVLAFKPDIIHCLHGTRSQIFLNEIFTHTTVPLVTTLTGTDYNTDDDSSHLSKSLSVMLQRSSAIITFHSFAQDILLEAFSNLASRIFIIPQSVKLRTNTENKINVRNKYGYTEDNIIILMAGGIRSIKNIDFAIDACAEIEKLKPEIKLVLAGPIIEKDTADVILQKGSKLNCFSYQGELSHTDIRDLMHSSDIFLNTSISEGMSGSILEAMSESLPVIATKNIGNASIINNNRSGFLVDPEKIDEMINKIVHLISDSKLREKMGNNGRIMIEKNHSSKTEVDQHISLYHYILKNGGISEL